MWPEFNGKVENNTDLFTKEVSSLRPCPYKEVKLVIWSVDVISDDSQWGESSRLVSFHRYSSRVPDCGVLVVDGDNLHVYHMANRMSSIRQLHCELVLGVFRAIVVVPVIIKRRFNILFNDLLRT